jgi:hypothetical protein
MMSDMQINNTDVKWIQTTIYFTYASLVFNSASLCCTQKWKYHRQFW